MGEKYSYMADLYRYGIINFQKTKTFKREEKSMDFKVGDKVVIFSKSTGSKVGTSGTKNKVGDIVTLDYREFGYGQPVYSPNNGHDLYLSKDLKMVPKCNIKKGDKVNILRKSVGRPMSLWTRELYSKPCIVESDLMWNTSKDYFFYQIKGDHYAPEDLRLVADTPKYKVLGFVSIAEIYKRIVNNKEDGCPEVKTIFEEFLDELTGLYSFHEAITYDDFLKFLEDHPGAITWCIKNGFIEKVKPAVSYVRGDIFKYFPIYYGVPWGAVDEYYKITGTGRTKEVVLTKLGDDGNAWALPVVVKDRFKITEGEFNQLCGSSRSRFTKVENAEVSVSEPKEYTMHSEEISPFTLVPGLQGTYHKGWLSVSA